MKCSTRDIWTLGRRRHLRGYRAPATTTATKRPSWHYEAYPAMVHRTLMDIIEECERQADGVHAVAHRTSGVRIGDAAVVIGSAPLRSRVRRPLACASGSSNGDDDMEEEFALDGVEWVIGRERADGSRRCGAPHAPTGTRYERVRRRLPVPWRSPMSSEQALDGPVLELASGRSDTALVAAHGRQVTCRCGRCRAAAAGQRAVRQAWPIGSTSCPGRRAAGMT